MSTTFTVAANDLVYTVVEDCETTYAAVITGQITDEILGTFDSSVFTIQTGRPDLLIRTAGNGLYAICAYLPRSFPKHASQSYTVAFTLTAPGFRSVSMSVTIPAAAPLPVEAPAVKLRRLPVRLQGRAVNDTTGVPAPSLNIMCVDNPSPPSPPPPPPLPHTLLLRSPMYGAHVVNTQVQNAALAVTGTAHLTSAAAAGTTSILLDTTVGLSGTAFVQLASLDFTRMEYITVATVGPPPGLVQLNAPLNRSYAPGAATKVQFLTATLTGPVAHLLIDADAGDGVLVADRLLSAGTVGIDTGAAMEYHELGALTDADGYYAADGIGRVPELFLRPNPGTPGLPTVSWFIEYDQPINAVNFRI